MTNATWRWLQICCTLNVREQQRRGSKSRRHHFSEPCKYLYVYIHKFHIKQTLKLYKYQYFDLITCYWKNIESNRCLDCSWMGQDDYNVMWHWYMDLMFLQHYILHLFQLQVGSSSPASVVCCGVAFGMNMFF